MGVKRSNVGGSIWLIMVLLTATATTLASAQAKPTATAAEPDKTTDTYQIYSLLMPGQVFSDMDAGKPWAISDTTVNEDDLNPKLAPDATLQPPSDNPRGFGEALFDYRQRKKRTHGPDPPLRAEPAIRLAESEQCGRV